MMQPALPTSECDELSVCSDDVSWIYTILDGDITMDIRWLIPRYLSSRPTGRVVGVVSMITEWILDAGVH